MRELQLIARHDALRRSLPPTLARLAGREVAVGSGAAEALPGTVIVATTDAVSAADCERLVAGGHEVVMLAAFPTPDEETSYRRAGVRDYLPMVIDTLPLAAALMALSWR
jgi:hypothetical protein